MKKSNQGGDVSLSKALSWILRHGAVKEKLTISDDGYISVNTILNHRSFSKYNLSDIIRVVERNDKQRFSLRSNSATNELEIKANQGHSVKVQNLELRPLECNDTTVVVHGTYLKKWEKIKQNGLSRMSRNHIHFAPAEPGDANVMSGIRSDCEVYIYMNVEKLLEDGIPLLVSPNQVILSPGNEAGIIHPKYFNEVKFVESSTSARNRLVCKIHVGDDQTWADHLSEKRHQASLEAMSEGTGIFVRGFENGLKHQHLRTFFSAFGQIEDVILNKRQMFAIIEFCHRESAELALSREIFLQGKKLKIAPRKGKPRFNKTLNTVSKAASTSTKSTAKGDNETLVRVPSPNLSRNAFDLQAEEFVRIKEATEIETKVKMLCQSLEKSLAPHFPGCQIHPFGSSVTGLASKDSDVDIFVDLYDIKSPAKIDHSASNIVFEIKRILCIGYEFSKCIAIPKAKVPIVKCFHKSTKLSCDINFQNALGIHNSNLIKFYISMEPRVRTVLMIIKHWAKINELCGPGNLTSYAFVMLLLNYLQQMPNPILPTVQRLQSMCKTVVKVQGWECQFKCDIKECSTNVNMGSLLKVLGGFFSFYSSFNFEENVIVLKTASAVPKYLFDDPPENLPCHAYKISSEMVDAQPISLDKVMCVLDPFVLNHNITAAVGLRELNKFQIWCFKSANVCARMENGDEATNLKTLFVVQPKQKKTKYPYLESWGENGDVKLIIPLTSFNPRNSFETSKSEPNSSGTGKLLLLIEHLKEIFEKVLQLVFVSAKKERSSVTSEKQIQKVEGMEDVHGDSAHKEFETITFFYSSFYQVWNGRNNAYKQFSFPSTMSLMEKEMLVTNYLVDTYYKGFTEGLQKMDVKCIFVPIMENRCLELQMTSCDGSKSIRPMITFLLTLLHKWLEK